MNLQVSGAFLVQSETYAVNSMEIKRPSQTVLFADAAFVTRATMNHPLRQWQEDASRSRGCWTLRTPSDSLWHIALARLMPRHHGCANAAFVDWPRRDTHAQPTRLRSARWPPAKLVGSALIFPPLSGDNFCAIGPLLLRFEVGDGLG